MLSHLLKTKKWVHSCYATLEQLIKKYMGCYTYSGGQRLLKRKIFAFTVSVTYTPKKLCIIRRHCYDKFFYLNQFTEMQFAPPGGH